MKPIIELDIYELKEFLLAIAPTQPVFIWGPPGIGKSSVVNQFSEELAMECVPLTGSNLASEDLIGVPKIDEKVSRFVPPSLIYREKDFCLFIDELNIASSEVQKSFYSLINEKRVGEYKLPEGSIVIGAGNRASDSALVKILPSALINRMVHVHLKVNHRIWLDWARNNNVHQLVIEYIESRPKHLSTDIAPGNEEPFSTPRSWKFVSDGLIALENTPNNDVLVDALIYGWLTYAHAQSFKAFMKKYKYKYSITSLIKGDTNWPDDPKDRDLLMFLVGSVRDHLITELPKNNDSLTSEKKKLVIDFKDCLKKLSYIDNEFAQNIISETESGDTLPVWFLTEITKEFPKLVMIKNKNENK